MAMFHSRFVGQFAVLTLLVAAAEAQASSKPSEAELAAITARGVLLAEYDTGAWQTTDAVQAAHPVEGRVGRYIARKTDAGWVVAFGRLNQAQDRFLVTYEAAQVSAKFEVKSFDPAREDTGWNLAAAKGIETAMRDFGATSRTTLMSAPSALRNQAVDRLATMNGTKVGSAQYQDTFLDARGVK